MTKAAWRTGALAVSLGLLIVLEAAAGDAGKGPPEGWQEYTPKGKAKEFSVWLPVDGKRREQVKVINPQKILLRFTSVGVEAKDGTSYHAGTILFQKQQDIIRVPLVKRIEFVRDLYVDLTKGKVVDTRDIKQGRVKGKEYLIEGAAITMKVRGYAFAGTIYTASVAGTKQQVESKDATLFLDSFKLPERVVKVPEKQ